MRLTTVSSLDISAAALSSSLLLLSLASAASVLHLRLLPSRRLRGLNTLWPVRLLLLLFASLWSLSELLPFIPPHHHSPALCVARSLLSQSFAQPCFLAALLFLLRSSANPPSSPSAAFSAALPLTLASSLPFLALHTAFLSLDLRRLGLPPDFFRESQPRCCHPLFGTLLLAALGAVYVPLFVTAGWGAVSVVINKRLLRRIYALVVAVVVALSVQVAALALSALWNPGGTAAEGLGFAAFIAFFACVATGEVILVLQPVMDALAVGEPDGTTTDPA